MGSRATKVAVGDVQGVRAWTGRDATNTRDPGKVQAADETMAVIDVVDDDGRIRDDIQIVADATPVA